MAAGLDSLSSVELTNALQRKLGMQLPPTLVFDYPSVNAIAEFASSVLQPSTTTVPSPDFSASRAVAVPSTCAGAVIAVTAVTGRMPELLGASMVTSQGLSSLQDCSRVIPADRWSADLQLTQDMPARFGMFLTDPYHFDAAVFATAESEAVVLDPQQRLLLESTFEVYSQHQGRAAAPHAPGKSPVGVFVGISTPDYADLGKAHSSIGVYTATGSALSVAAGRLSYFFGFAGPAVSVDTACSSSLVGTHMACLSIREGTCSAATTAGVKLILTPSTTAMFKRAGMLAPDGRCKTLDSSADGSLTAPNGPAQQGVIRQALRGSGIVPNDVTTLQMHGTGTNLGDPIELAAASAVLLSEPNAEGNALPLSLAAGKSSIGHTEPAAGLAGVFHALHSMQACLTQPILHFRQLNPHLEATFSNKAAGRGLLLPKQLQGMQSKAMQQSARHLPQHSVEQPLYAITWQAAETDRSSLLGSLLNTKRIRLAGGNDAAVVIKGGGGMIGSLVSQWILKEGKPRSVKLLSRTGRASPERTFAILGCPEARAGAMISIAMCDVSISEDSRHCFDSEYNQSVPVTAIIHAGGVLSDAIVDAVASVLGSSVASNASLMDVGLDSLSAVELRNALGQQFELDLPATFTFDYPSVQAMAGFISSLLGEPGSSVGGVVEQHVVGQPQNDQRLVVASRPDTRRDMQAITGLSVRFASIDSMGDLHHCLVSQQELQTVAPSSRWDTESTFNPLPSPGQVCSRFGTYVESTYDFDSAVFGLQPNEALLMDPQQRLLLEETLSAFHDANYSAVDMSGSSTGVFLGCMWVEYPDLLMKHGLTSGAYTVTGNGLAFLAGRVSYTFGLTGPCVPTNTACSSSLVATHLASTSISHGDCRMATASGVNAILVPEAGFAAVTQVRALAVDGRCKSFGAEGDGYGRGEGYTTILLEPMGSDNERAGEVKAVLMGSAVNQDGRSGGLTAPHGPSQQALITSAMQRAGVSFLPYVSSHGTGTPLGDPIETGALRKAIASPMADTGSQVFTLGAVKSLTGHLEGTAGLAGLMLCMLQLQQCSNPPLRYRNLNPYVVIVEGHPFLTRTVAQANKTVVMQMLTNHPALAYLKDHMVQGTAILPAAALLELTADTGSAQHAVVRALELWQAEAVIEPVGGAVASVAVERAEDASSYWVHPAALDSCLQLGAVVPEQRQGSGDFNEGTSFVPVGAKLFHVPEKLVLGEQLASSASVGSGLGNLPVPLAHWDVEEQLGNGRAGLAARFGGFLEGLELFDGSLFGLSVNEAELMDPQQRMLLETSYQAMSSSSQQLSGTRTAVAIGIASAEYNNYVVSRHSPGVGVYSATGGALSVASGRLSYTFGLKGPAMSVDTACSSSLVAAHLVITHLSSSAVSAGLVGGVSVLLSPTTTAMFHKAGMLSPDGRCKAIDAAADGYVRGEGCGVILLQQQEASVDHAAVADVLAVFRGSAVNQDGRSSSLTAPNGPSQQGVIRQALQGSVVEPHNVTGVQMHGTGTPLGDPIELGAIQAVLIGSGQRAVPLQVAAAKSWVGHTEAASGVMGLLQAALGLQQLTAPGVMHLTQVNPQVPGASDPHTVFPAAGCVELCSSAAAMLSPNKDVSGLVIKDAVLPALLPLTHRMHGINKVQIMIDTLRGSVKVASVSSGSRQSLHLTASISQLAKTASATGSTPAAQQLPAAWKLLVLVSPSADQKMAVGAYVGIGTSDYNTLMQQSQVPFNAFSFTAGSASVASGRLAFAFGLQGPTASIDTACSASLVAAHMACQSFRDHSVEGALVAGVLLCLVPQSTGMLQRAGMIAPDGRCKTLDAAADGYVRAETCRTMYLMPPYSQGVSSGMHSNGTPLGDPIEVGAASAVLLQNIEARQVPLTLATVKGYTGHEEAGAGVAGLMEALNLVSHASAPPALHLRTLNPHVAATLQGRAVGIVRGGPAPMGQVSADGLLVTGVSSFGAQGTNAHAIVRGSNDGMGSAGRRGEVRLQTARCWVAPAMQVLLSSVRIAPSEEAAVEGGLPVDTRMLQMGAHERKLYIQAQVTAEVRAMVGHSIHPEEPLMSAGLDSRGGMELRRALGETLGLDLPVTLLYDYQSILAIVTYINSLVEAQAQAQAQTQAADGVEAETYWSDEQEEEARAGPARRGVVALAEAAAEKPSKLLKTLRGAATQSPLFLAAPGVANAQSAYFSFSQFLQWSDQPIYVLDKDNDLNIAQLARQNASDIVKVQPEGPYLLGGHSYGGAVAMEVAMVLESWGHEIGAVLIMDTPLPGQIRPIQQEAGRATEADVMELVEMILGALGRDALGLGSSIAHPRESEEWKSMTPHQKLEFFAPIWRIMRDENMTVEQVTEQVEHVALAVKQGSEISDLRHHTFSATALKSGKVVYFRARQRGACTYFDDSRKGPLAHGLCWAPYCNDLQVVDVPGDHFSLLRQDEKDMSIIVDTLQMVLSAFGWHTTIKRDQKIYNKMNDADIQEMDKYLQKMGVQDQSARRGVEPQVSGTDVLQVQPAASASVDILPLNASARTAAVTPGLSSTAGITATPCFVVLDDAWRGSGDLADVFEGIQQPCFGLQLLQEDVMQQPTDLPQLAGLYGAALRQHLPNNSPCIIGGVGLGTMPSMRRAKLVQQVANQSRIAPVVAQLKPVVLWSLSTACVLKTGLLTQRW
ncbi:hypothetical protein WJX82_000056 [Trebouxia sp. C0006]